MGIDITCRKKAEEENAILASIVAHSMMLSLENPDGTPCFGMPVQKDLGIQPGR